MTPDQYCHQKAARSGSTFYYSLLFTDPDRRRAATALHALCIELKQIVEQTADENAARIKIAWWRNEIGEIYKRKPQHLVSRALAPFIEPCAIAQAQLEAIANGAEMDLLQTRYLDFLALQHYCDLVGGAVGHCAAGIFGSDSEATRQSVYKLGAALRLASMIRNVGEHARMGRVYLPIDELQQFHVPVADVLNARYSDNFRALMEFQYVRALIQMETAVSALPAGEKRMQMPALVMTNLYRALLSEIRADGFQVLHQRSSLTPIRKLWLAWRTRVTNH